MVLGLAAQATASTFGPALRRLFRAQPTCQLGHAAYEAEQDAKRHGRQQLDGHRSLKSFADPDGAE